MGEPTRHHLRTSPDQASPTTTTPGRASQVDLGRVVVVVMFVLTMVLAVGRATTLVISTRAAGGDLQTAVELVSTALTLTFCAVVVSAYLRRGPARGTDRHVGAWLAAPAGTCLPFVIPALPHTLGGTTRSLAATALILAGTSFSVWAVRHLDTCLSIVPQARTLVDTGPYRWVRHPLYLGEIVTVTGFALRAGHLTHLLVLAALIALQLYRAHREEVLLVDLVPGYADYRRHTWRILPRLR
jgi:protein-S-isoprenylcysteine O-methyltransferase Ste14